MTIRRKTLLFAIALAVASACQSSGGNSLRPNEAAAFPRYPTWVEIMENIMDPNYFDVMRAEAKKGEGQMNLSSISRAAEESADYVALGYGIHRDQSGEDIAELARSAEKWLREIASRAHRGDRSGLPQLIIEGEVEYCDRCHDAAR